MCLEIDRTRVFCSRHRRRVSGWRSISRAWATRSSLLIRIIRADVCYSQSPCEDRQEGCSRSRRSIETLALIASHIVCRQRGVSRHRCGFGQGSRHCTRCLKQFVASLLYRVMALITASLTPAVFSLIKASGVRSNFEVEFRMVVMIISSASFAVTI